MRKEWKNSSLWPSVATEILSFQLHSPRTLHPASFPCQLTCISNKMSMAEHASRSKALWFPAGWSKHFQVDIPKYWYFQIWKTFNPIPDKKYSTYISRNAVLPYGWLNEKCSTCIISINVVPSTFSLVFFFLKKLITWKSYRGERQIFHLLVYSPKWLQWPLQGSGGIIQVFHMGASVQAFSLPSSISAGV